MSKIADQETAYNDVVALAETINNDPLIEDDEAETIDKIASSLTSKWEIINDSINTRSQRFVSSQLVVFGSKIGVIPLVDFWPTSWTCV